MTILIESNNHSEGNERKPLDATLEYILHDYRLSNGENTWILVWCTHKRITARYLQLMMLIRFVIQVTWMCTCVFVCAVLFMLLFSLRDKLKRQEIKLMEANQSRGRRFRLKRPHPTRLGRSATLCRRACTYAATCMCGSLCLLACLRQQPAWPFPVYHLAYFAVLPLLQLIIYSLSRHSADQFNRGGKTGVRKWYF